MDHRPRILPSNDPLTVSKDDLLTLTCRYAARRFLCLSFFLSLLLMYFYLNFK